jgi:tRNA dimethylallyltransferase
MSVRLPPAIFLMGPTASGKTALTVALARQLPIEVISVDSALVYRDMDIGTAKPDAETLQHAPHFLINLISPLQAYSAAQFRTDALALMQQISERGNVPLLVGGTMLYFNALQSGLNQLPQADPALRAKLDEQAAQIGWKAMHEILMQHDPVTAKRLQATDTQRIQRALEVFYLTGQAMSSLHQQESKSSLPYRLLKLALVPADRSVLHQRIAIRFAQMLEMGLVDEVRHLLECYPTLTQDLPAMRCVGYRQTLQYLAGEFDQDELLNRGIYATRQLAKRQLTWLRGMQDCVNLDCLAPDIEQQVVQHIRHFLSSSD